MSIATSHGAVTEVEEIQITSKQDEPVTSDSNNDDESVLIRVVQGPNGVTRWFEKSFSGSRRCQPRFTEWGEAEKIQQCPGCEEFHNANSPPYCFGCTFGLR
ncbi:hypothetical protein D3D01_15635 [Haloarcula sp. Atlit-7R]|nr:hypothetical protein D3D01_15635 [Haloarcula sp. Atlit-7R]